jgi:putative acetyltransferase
MREIRPDDLTGPEIAALLATHAETMRAASPPGSCHYLPIDGLRHASVSVWSLWEEGELLGCGALRDLGDGTGEIKSMHTRAAGRGRGVGGAMLAHLIEEASRRGYTALYLETGSMDAFQPARRLYEGSGFAYCGPFAGYVEDPNSVFMKLGLG